MSINLQTLHLSGTVLFALGVLIAVLSIGLFVAVSHGVHEGISIAEADKGVVGEDGTFTFPHVDVMAPGMKERIVFLAPVLAGVIMAVSGVVIRSKVPEWKADSERRGVISIRVESTLRRNREVTNPVRDSAGEISLIRGTFLRVKHVLPAPWHLPRERLVAMVLLPQPKVLPPSLHPGETQSSAPRYL